MSKVLTDISNMKVEVYHSDMIKIPKEEITKIDVNKDSGLLTVNFIDNRYEGKRIIINVSGIILEFPSDKDRYAYDRGFNLDKNPDEGTMLTMYKDSIKYLKLGLKDKEDNNYGHQIHKLSSIYNITVHESHCCEKHGCKYGDPDCPVVTRKTIGIRCESCDHDLDRLRSDPYWNKLKDILFANGNKEALEAIRSIESELL